MKGKEDQYEILSVGNLLRKARAEQTELGKQAASYMDSGALVPDDIINAIVIDGLKAAKKPTFTDGFPRTVPQAEAMLQAGLRPARVIEFYVDDKVVVQRACNRIVCKDCGEPYTTGAFKAPMVAGVCDKCGGTLVKRDDDREEVVRNRLEVYQQETYPVLDVFLNANIPVYTINNDDSEIASKEFADLMTSL